jgi:hypothetical protein
VLIQRAEPVRRRADQAARALAMTPSSHLPCAMAGSGSACS